MTRKFKDFNDSLTSAEKYRDNRPRPYHCTPAVRRCRRVHYNDILSILFMSNYVMIFSSSQRHLCQCMAASCAELQVKH